MRPLYAEIDLTAIQANFDLLARKAGNATCIAVIKADAYGHGMVPVARALVGKASKFAVACLEEALELEQAGVNQPKMILEGFFSAEDIPQGKSAETTEWVVHSDEQLSVLKRLQLKVPCKIWIKINTGMNRLGFHFSRLQAILDSVSSMPMVLLQGIVTHFASADQPASESFKQQLISVNELRKCLKGMLPLSAANSAGVLLHPDLYFDWVRPGIALYGCSPVADRTGADYGLRPAMSLMSQIIACRDLNQGDAVGYGANWQSSASSRMGVVAIGYGDGYPRQVGNGAPVIVAGVETKIIGRVSMDMVTVDLSSVACATIGSEVELWGKRLPADRLAIHADTISYHLLTGVTKRVPRRYFPAHQN